MKKIMKFKLSALVLFAMCSACGIKGPPLPPLVEDAQVETIQMQKLQPLEGSAPKSTPNSTDTTRAKTKKKK